MLYVYLFSCAVLFIYATTMFALACIKKDNSIMDIAYGPAFLVASYVTAFIALTLFPLAPHSVLILLFITIWALRLATRIYRKNKGKPEDFRYKAWRDAWMLKGKAYFYTRSYLQIFLLQALVVSIVLLPFTLTVQNIGQFMVLSYLGIALWCIGFLFESIADAQLDRFIKDPNPLKGLIMHSGLWKYSRHPNYFGESLMWWGLAFLGFSISGNPFVFLSPILITYLLLYVSGIPMLEKRFTGNPEWETYKARTSAFVPMPPKQDA